MTKQYTRDQLSRASVFCGTLVLVGVFQVAFVSCLAAFISHTIAAGGMALWSFGLVVFGLVLSSKISDIEPKEDGA